MKKEISLKSSVFIIGIVGMIFSLIIIFTGMPAQGSDENIVSVVHPTAGVPLHLKISEINIDAVVEQVGLTSTGAMDVPAGPNNTAWFKMGPRPGEVGSSVIDGHSGYKDNIPAVFDSLDKLQIGDKIYVEDKNGVTETFVVRKIQNYDQNQNATDVFYSNDGLAHLNLITCSGVWDVIKKSHSTRLVVFTDLVAS